MKPAILLLVALVLGSILAESVEARGRRGRRRGRYYSTSYNVGVSFAGTDQQMCYQKAKYMHEHGIRGHVGIPIGFEGWGFGGPGCATCTPRGGMTLTGDAHYGSIRVRSWR